ncbi:MAG: thiamine pyrophosphate-dependent enzyme [Methanothrix sp.]|uniref:thiamine pyrophosphate-dependent enzyme n=1 Tax=Methanothrix sp. TaxID=90426 RepID=UPI0025F7D503|nr:thiamine pyrophosphate-dependent enzyme [Methanothrix sp.]MCQ8903375.1 thiamine pyrophosphate-dependent enzyme [Methanothrix sp.]
MRGALKQIHQALRDVGAGYITYVPGYPVTDLAQSLGAEIAVNEKVALECALGASATGIRSMVIVKQLGMNILADPLAISTTHTTGAGIVVLVGDDLGPRGSQIEMDSRFYGPLTGLPVLDPSAPDLYRAVTEAFRVSEELSIPVILRTTSDVLEDASAVADLSDMPSHLGDTPRCFDRSIWELTAKGRHQRHLAKVLPALREASESSARMDLRGDTGVIASGSVVPLAETVCEETGSSLLVPLYSHPLPLIAIERFLEMHRLVLVAEGPGPFIESHLKGVRGRLTGHLPYGPIKPNDLRTAIGLVHISDLRGEIEMETAAGRPARRSICQSCPFLPLYSALSRMDVPIAGDAGCTILSLRMGAVDMVYGLGSSIGVASGFKEKGIAIVGDYALAHTGIQGLINAIWHRKNVLVGVIWNRVAAMTGFQEVFDLEHVLRALVPEMRILEMPAPEQEIERILREELRSPGVSLVIFKGTCVKQNSRPY